ncbi:hypothetical protein L596_011503 [Steinernema carpocapsae]|uniref:Uncharacterized protein n=1 Tax=Steinernema carpocapsae TaxID=34508 RepID=A0A4U5NUI7_STECR|nr:hypothetical protein L596_011503 [Steinernema carpocapsae]
MKRLIALADPNSVLRQEDFHAGTDTTPAEQSTVVAEGIPKNRCCPNKPFSKVRDGLGGSFGFGKHEASFLRTKGTFECRRLPAKDPGRCGVVLGGEELYRNRLDLNKTKGRERERGSARRRP